MFFLMIALIDIDNTWINLEKWIYMPNSYYKVLKVNSNKSFLKSFLEILV